MEALLITVKGLVQGVGFRPFIYRIAIKNDIKGWVDNRTDGVYIHAEGKDTNIESFIKSIKSEAPPASNISGIKTTKTHLFNHLEFSIVKSKDLTNNITEISPDISVCDDCLHDLKNQKHRINYPFINCTNCGPRFTIIKDLPYDRNKTTMAPFEMCNNCSDEYKDISDRRFHAQPVACELCGPKYTLHHNNTEINSFDEIVKVTAKLIDRGKIIAIKGLGGYFIACDANNNEAVKKLRGNKIREGKPLAVMCSNISEARKYCHINNLEERELSSWRRPILLLKKHKNLAKSITNDFNTLGVMLPYMPLHHILFGSLKTKVIVLTSGNISEEPIIIDDNRALIQLGAITDAILSYNREIYNRADDSVKLIAGGNSRIIRRSRGFVPNPINLSTNVDGILATGAELVNCFCIGKSNQAIMSQHIGDLKNPETLEFYTESIDQFKKLFRFKPEFVACDIHPDYLSTKYAIETGLKKIEIQHHHAHIASCLAENNIKEKVIGIAMDGTGLGTDGKIWGGEFFLCDDTDFQRYCHFDYIPIPGGDIATKEPWRTGLSMLYKVYGNELWNLQIPFIQNINREKSEILIQAIEKNLNCPESSSAGRLFDAIASIMNLCTTSQFHAEAPMRLESILQLPETGKYPYDIGCSISFNETIKYIVTDLIKKTKTSIISAKFHNTFISVIFDIITKMSEEFGVKKVVLSGGTFQNRYILENTINVLVKNNFAVFSNSIVPANDGGIALGQLLIAANKIKKL